MSSSAASKLSISNTFQNKLEFICFPSYLRPEEDDPSAAAAKRNQTTAVILCGVIGALFDLELEKVKIHYLEQKTHKLES